MKRKFAIVMLIFAFTSCANKKEQPSAEVLAPIESTTDKTLGVAGEACFDRKMDQWFISFNKFQDEGASMAEADGKALAEAEVEFKQCKEAIAKLMSKAKE